MAYKSLLAGVNSPDDIKKMNYLQMNKLCEELRTELIDTVSKTGGHLSSSLGVVEL
ncbi:MAG: 1-deoxy-D-xylulose-5-phosphate synthase N-terminal domain-containing protein, partial [Hydrogenoanaerobacterium sp.]